jgi:hypothetical protein
MTGWNGRRCVPAIIVLTLEADGSLPAMCYSLRLGAHRPTFRSCNTLCREGALQGPHAGLRTCHTRRTPRAPLACIPRPFVSHSRRVQEIERKRRLEEALTQRKRSSRLAAKDEEKERHQKDEERKRDEEERMGRERRALARQQAAEAERLKQEQAREQRRKEREDRERRRHEINGQEQEERCACHSALRNDLTCCIDQLSCELTGG